MNKKLLLDLLFQPTAPFREEAVIRWYRILFQKHQIPNFIDEVGNLVVGAASLAEYQALLAEKTSEPLRILVAHMDHPGFHVNGPMTGKGAKGDLLATWHGGSPVKGLTGTKVWLADREGYRGFGKIKSVKIHPSKWSMESLVISPIGKIEGENHFGGFAFQAPAWERQNKIYTKAADDLVGTFAIGSLAISHPEYFKEKRMIGLLTRAEEVGFIGAIGHIELGYLHKAQRELFLLSLETSRTLPGALIGKGPIVRLGDRKTVFESGYVENVTQIAEKVLPKKYQRRIMDGGTCEATAMIAYGFKATGISLPLGNYHNQNFEGGPGAKVKGGPAPEFVHMEDLKGMLKLCEALMEPGAITSKVWSSRSAQFKKSYQDSSRLLALLDL